jgi:hypothetical protein
MYCTREKIVRREGRDLPSCESDVSGLNPVVLFRSVPVNGKAVLGHHPFASMPLDTSPPCSAPSANPHLLSLSFHDGSWQLKLTTFELWLLRILRESCEVMGGTDGLEGSGK